MADCSPTTAQKILLAALEIEKNIRYPDAHQRPKEIDNNDVLYIVKNGTPLHNRTWVEPIGDWVYHLEGECRDLKVRINFCVPWVPPSSAYGWIIDILVIN